MLPEKSTWFIHNVRAAGAESNMHRSLCESSCLLKSCFFRGKESETLIQPINGALADFLFVPESYDKTINSVGFCSLHIELSME